MSTENKKMKPVKRHRTGCWTCKERRVKCNEGRPICGACERLGLVCQYGIKLLWREDALSRGIALGRSGTFTKKRGKVNQECGYDANPDRWLSVHHQRSDVQAAFTEDWMFLNTTYQDFLSENYDLSLDDGRIDETKTPSSTSQLFPLAAPAHDLLDWEGFSLSLPGDDLFTGLELVDSEGLSEMNTWTEDNFPLPFLTLQNPSPFLLDHNETYLLDYFINGLSPRCALWPTDNPFNRTMVPICLSAPHKPLFNTVMAVACNQLSLLDDKRFEKDIWIYRSRALRGFQEDIGKFQGEQESLPGWEHIVATLVMLAFFDISQNAPSAWLAHLRFARTIRALLPVSNQLSAEQIDLCRFFSVYFAEHEAFARTASTVADPYQTHVSWFSPELSMDMTAIDSLLGCSHELISIISEISDLADEKESVPDSLEDESDCLLERRKDLRKRRDDIERRLHSLEQTLPTASPDAAASNPEAIEELGHIAETRRLSAMIYLYCRLDDVPPGSPPIDRLTNQILALIPKISLRSHALLWPLFVVGTMGLGISNRGEGDADRKFVLERLVSLQNTRQLRNVGRARRAVEAIWRARDLRGPETQAGWRDIISVRSGGVSLC